MNIRKILTIATLFLVLLSCSKEEALVASNPNSTTSLQFPEGTAFDDITVPIYEKFGVKIYWGDKINNSHVNRAWTSTDAALKFNYLNQEQAGNMIHFLNDHVFSKMNPDIFNRSLKPNIYLLYDLHTLWGGIFFSPIVAQYTGMDNWLFSMYGDPDKYTLFPPHKLPATNAEIRTFRKGLFMMLFVDMFDKGVIKMPVEFETEFDYTPRDLKYRTDDAQHPDFFMNHKFCGTVAFTTGSISQLWNTSGFTAKNNFLTYLTLVYTYSKEEIEAGAGINNIPFKKFPAILHYYDLVDKYMIEKYNYDLKQLHK